MVAVTALGLAAAFLFALSAYLQQRAARAAVGPNTAALHAAPGVTHMFGRLVRSRTWLAGWLTNLSGVGTQAAALKVGSVATVQPLMAAQLLFVLSLSSLDARRWPTRRDWLSALAVAAGLVLLFTADASPRSAEPHRHRVLAATVCVAALVVVLRQISRHAYPWLCGLLVGVAAGLCHALNAVFLKLTVEDLHRVGPFATLLDWPVYALAATAFTGMLLVQIAFASGPLPPAVAAMSVTNPVASLALGVLAFDAPAPRDPVVLSAIAVSGLLIAVGIVGLANGPGARSALQGDSGPDGLWPTRRPRSQQPSGDLTPTTRRRFA